MSMPRYVPECPFCGKRGIPTTTSTPSGPSGDPSSRISGKCPANPNGSGKHGGKWIRIG